VGVVSQSQQQWAPAVCWLPLIASRNTDHPYCHPLLDRVVLSAAQWPTNAHQKTVTTAYRVTNASQTPTGRLTDGDHPSTMVSHCQHSGLITKLSLLCYTGWHIWLIASKWAAGDVMIIKAEKVRAGMGEMSDRIKRACVMVKKEKMRNKTSPTSLGSLMKILLCGQVL